jgi:hypothetical protein
MATSFFLYADGVEGHTQYKGRLPRGLSFSHTRQQIESLLGKPSKFGGAGISNYWEEYKTMGMLIAYNTKSHLDFNARISHIALTRP